jgi:chromosome condensin MukBEF ATPase and DNA-binding subunit MukB
MGNESHPTMTYPTEEQYERWEEKANELGMSMSEFVESMVEAGMKKFDVDVDPDETNQELRQQRNELQEELARSRDRIDTLETRLYTSEKAEIEKFVRQNPGATYDEIVQQVIDTAAGRVTTYLDEMEGDQLRTEDGTYYPRNGEGS